MTPRIAVVIGDAPTAYTLRSESGTGRTVVALVGGTLTLEGTEGQRRKLAQAVAEACGLAVVDPTHRPPARVDRPSHPALT